MAEQVDRQEFASPADLEATVRENVSHIARGCRASSSHNPAVHEQAIDAALALLRERAEQVADPVTRYERGDDFSHHYWHERAEELERERDEWASKAQMNLAGWNSLAAHADEMEEERDEALAAQRLVVDRWERGKEALRERAEESERKVFHITDTDSEARVSRQMRRAEEAEAKLAEAFLKIDHLNEEANELGDCCGAADARVRDLEDAIRWALGETDFGAAKPEYAGRYWWRKELRARATLHPSADASEETT